jgi:glycosyltransferase involved in cell wall biosynthesis
VAPSVAIVHDYLTQRGGAERVVLAMLAAFPDAPVYTSVYEPATTFPEFRDHDVRTLWTDSLGPLHADHRRGLALYPFAFGARRIDADVVLCSSSGFAHGVATSGRKVVYCHTPARWLYEDAERYLTGWCPAVGRFARALGGPLRQWDRRAARSADVTLANSSTVRDRIARAYDVDAELLPPPVSIDLTGEQRAVSGVAPGFLLSVGRLLAYKHMDAVADAMAALPDHHLVIAGTGPEQAHLEALAGPNVSLTGEVDDAQLRWLYAHCAGVVSAAWEDFGLTPLEAAAYGKPAAVLRRGGFLDTVVEDVTGVFFDEPTPSAIAEGIMRLTQRHWDAGALADHGVRFNEETFCTRLACAAGVAREAASL